MSNLRSAVIIAGHAEGSSLSKKLGQFRNALSTVAEPQPHKGAITEQIVENANSIWFIQPKSDIKQDEVTILDNFIQKGGAIILFATALPPNLTNFIKKRGITISEDVISPSYICYVDPRHVTVQGGIVNRAISEFANDQKATFAYPNGRDLELQAPAFPLLASGLSSYPLNRPILGFSPVGDKGGSLIVAGSYKLFNDEWIKKESNEKLFKYILELAIMKTQKYNTIDAENPEITERWYTPDVQSMSEKFRCCLQEGEKLRVDFPQNFETGLFSMDLSYVAEVQTLAQTLGLKNEPLETVKPQFDTALPPLTPAVFPPQMREPPGPVLELFDLDDAFASPKTRLAQLAQRTPPKNVEKFIIQAAKILGILPKLPEGKQDAKHVLEYVFTQVARWKRQSQ